MKYYYTFTHSMGAMVYTSESGKKLVIYNGEYYRTIGEVQKLLREGKIERIGLKADGAKTEALRHSIDPSDARIEYLKSKGEL